MNQKFRTQKSFSPLALEKLSHYTWPGNVRELRNIVENLVVMSTGDVIDEKSLPSNVTQTANKNIFVDTPDYFESFKLKEIIADVEKEVVRKALAEFGDLRNTANHLGVDLSTLVRKKRKYQL